MSTGDIASVFFHARIHANADVAATILIWYDYLLTFGDEVEFFWGRRLSWMATLFFMNRYLVLLTQTFNLYPQVATNISYTFCKIAIGYVLTGSSIVQQLLVDSILCLRLYAIYGRSKVVLYCVATLLVVCTLSSAAIVGAVGLHTKGTAIPTPHLNLNHCTVETPYHFLWAFWIPILVYESTGFCMVIYKAYQYMRSKRILNQDGVIEGSRSTTSRLVEVLYRDSIMYFAAIFTLYVANAIVFAFPDPSVNGLLDGPTLVLIAILGNRVLFNLRSEDTQKSRSNSAGFTTSPGISGIVSTVQFAGQQESARSAADDEEIRVSSSEVSTTSASV